jgi:cyclin-dependent kinase 8/11
VPISLLKFCIHQHFNGLVYLHSYYILHRASNRPTPSSPSQGALGNLGLARLTYSPLQPVYTGEIIVVIVWYRAPELLLCARHVTGLLACGPLDVS